MGMGMSVIVTMSMAVAVRRVVPVIVVRAIMVRVIVRHTTLYGAGWYCYTITGVSAVRSGKAELYATNVMRFLSTCTVTCDSERKRLSRDW
jgi:hypothetical protein